MYRISDMGADGQPVETIIFLNKDELYGDVQTIKQIRTMASSPTVRHPRVMPDCHFGAGCCIGYTSELIDKVVPGYIGGDIGCGLTAYELGPKILKRIEKDPERVLSIIEQTVPTGDMCHPMPRDIRPVYSIAQENAQQFARSYGTKFAIDLSTYVPTYDEVWYTALLERIGLTRDKVGRQMGTMGAGNHYLELSIGPSGLSAGTDPTSEPPATPEPTAYIIVHSGSRGLGGAICRYHTGIIATGTKKDWDGYFRATKALARKIRNRADRLPADAELRTQYLEPKHPPYLEGPEAYAYYFDMIFAQAYAYHNRLTMIRDSVEALGADFDETKMFGSTHNYIDFGDMIWRKGAVRAGAGETVLIALNMRDGVLVARGTGNPEWNYSAPHGAGRRVPRNEARNHSTLKEFTETMKEICTHSVTSDTLDESPVMYKDPALIRERAGDTCTIIAQLRPLINLKGTER